MKVFGTGKFSGEVIDFANTAGISTSMTTYQKSGFDNELHFHDNTHISFVLHGGCAEKKRDQYERLPGKLTFYHAGEPHQVINVAACSRHINIEIEPSFFERNDLDENRVFSAMSENPDAKFLMLAIYREFVTADAYSSASVEQLLLDLAHKAQKIRHGQGQPLWVSIVREFLHDHWSDVVTLEELARMTGMHPVTISKYFRRYFSCTLGDYMRKLKVDKALSLIKVNGGNLTGIGYECGFADQSHFIRTFKLYTGVLPGDYQKAS